MDLKNKVVLLGSSIFNSLERAKEISKNVRKKNLSIGREIALVITKLEEAEHWRKQALELT